MAKHPKRPRDPNQFARMIVDLATGAIKNAIRGIVAAAGAAGIAEADVAARLPADTKRSSRYMAIRSLEEAGEIARRDGRLFPAQKAEEPGAATPGTSVRQLDLGGGE